MPILASGRPEPDAGLAVELTGTAPSGAPPLWDPSLDDAAQLSTAMQLTV